MAVSKMKKLTLLAEREYLKPVMLSFQSYQAVELITTTADNQRNLVNQYLGVSDEVEDSDEKELPYDTQIFENPSYESDINRLSHQLDDIEEYIEFLEEVLPSPGLMEKLRAEKATFSLYEVEEKGADLNISSLITEAENIRKRMERLEEEKERLEEEREFLNRWKSLDFNPKVTENFQVTEVYVGAVDTERNEALEEALHNFNEIYVEELNYNEEETIYLIITSANAAQDVENTLIRHRFERLHYSYEHLPEQELKANKERLDNVSHEMTHIEDKPKEYRQLLEELKLAEEYLFNKRERLRATESVLVSENLFVVTGWIEEDMYKKQIQGIESKIGQENMMTTVEDVKDSEVEDVPIKLKNKDSTSAFENVVEMYGLPKYGEIDPSGFVQPFMILFFGMMTGDAGYGLFALILILLAMKFLDFSSSVKQSLKFFGQLMIGTILAGLAYGSFFGFQLPFSLINMNDQLVESLGISIGIGIVHLIIGLILNVIQNNRRGDYAESYTAGLSWILILVGVSILGINMIAGGASSWNTVGLALIILNLIGIVLVTTLAAENKAAGLGQGLFGLMDVTGYIGDILSYTRLTALGVASVNIGMAFNLIVGMLPVWARFTVGLLIFAGLHLFYLFISFISAYVHSLRLNFVEFFGKFHAGGGREFSPIATLGKNFIIKNDTARD